MLFLGLLAGCAQTQYRFQYHGAQDQRVWPPEPDVARYRFVGFIYGESNLKKVEGSTGFFRKGVNWLGELIFGEEVPRHLHRPQSGVMDDKQQKLYITDVGKKSIYVFDLKSGKVDIWEGIDSDRNFYAPIALCLMGDEQLFVTDSERGLVLRFDLEGNFLDQHGENVFSRPTGIACDSVANRLYVADSVKHNIVIFDRQGNVLNTFGGKGEGKGKLNSPTHLSFNDGKLFVSDTLNARVQVFDADGNWLNSFGERGMYVGNLPRPKGVAVDSHGHIYVVESFYDHLIVYDSKGQGLLPIGGNGNQPGQFYLPAGVWVDANDRVYVADMFNSRIAVFQYMHNP